MAADDVAPERIASTEQALLPWLPHTETFTSVDPYVGAPVWSDDNTEVAGVALSYERQLSIPPLQGWWNKRNFRSRFFTQAVTPSGFGPRVYLGGEMAGSTMTVFDAKKAGYLLVHMADGKAYVLRAGRAPALLVDGGDPITPLGRSTTILPSPDGSSVAVVGCVYYREVPQPDGSILVEPAKPVVCKVRFFDPANGAQLGQATEVELPEATEVFDPSLPKHVTWTTANELVVTDRVATAFAFEPGGAPSAVAVPTCGGPATTSGRVAADGRRLGVTKDKVAVVGTVAPVAERFGCR